MLTFGTVPLVPVLRKFHFTEHLTTPSSIKHPSTFLTGDLVQDRKKPLNIFLNGAEI